MKKKSLFIIVATIFVLMLATTITLAYVRFQGVSKTQSASGTLHVALSQNTLSVDHLSDSIRSGEHIPKELYLSAMGSHNQYVRIHCYKYWITQSDGYEITPDTDATLIALNLTNPDHWIIKSTENNPGRFILYYRYPIEPDTMLQVFKSITIGNISNEKKDIYANSGIQIDVTVDGLQQIDNKDHADEDAMIDLWGIHANIDSTGTINDIT